MNQRLKLGSEGSGVSVCLWGDDVGLTNFVWPPFRITRYAESMSYRVQIAPRPIVIDDDGLPVPNSHVLEIIFPTDSIDTAAGTTSSIIGAGIAKILVADVTVRGVGLC